MNEKLNDLARQIHNQNKSKGFYDDPKNIGEMIALMHSELSEALEADRLDSYCTLDVQALSLLDSESKQGFRFGYATYVKGTFEEEMADTLIRILDMCAFKGIDIESHIKLKMKWNSMRKHKHGKRY